MWLDLHLDAVDGALIALSHDGLTPNASQIIREKIGDALANDLIVFLSKSVFPSYPCQICISLFLCVKTQLL